MSFDASPIESYMSVGSNTQLHFLYETVIQSNDNVVGQTLLNPSIKPGLMIEDRSAKNTIKIATQNVIELFIFYFYFLNTIYTV